MARPGTGGGDLADRTETLAIHGYAGNLLELSDSASGVDHWGAFRLGSDLSVHPHRLLHSPGKMAAPCRASRRSGRKTEFQRPAGAGGERHAGATSPGSFGQVCDPGRTGSGPFATGV